MKDTYIIKSDRYNHKHSFKQIKDNQYYFCPEEEWMGLRIIYGDNDDDVSLDTEGGPYIGKGWNNDEISIEKIIWDKKNSPIVYLKEK